MGDTGSIQGVELNPIRYPDDTSPPLDTDYAAGSTLSVSFLLAAADGAMMSQYLQKRGMTPLKPEECSGLFESR